MINIVKGSEETIRELRRIYSDDFSDIRKITVFKNQINFLFTEYRIDNNNVHMIIEDFSGRIISITGMNCGYFGEGPNATLYLLKKIGIDEKDAEKIILKDSIILEFKDKQNFDTLEISHKYYINTYFKGLMNEERNESFNLDNMKIYLGEDVKVDIVDRKVYMINPQVENFMSLLILIRLSDPKKIRYYIGEKSNIEPSIRSFDFFQDTKTTKGINMYIEGDKYDIACFVNKKEQFNVISSIYYYIFKESLFKVTRFKDMVIYSKDFSIWKLIKNIFINIFNKDIKEISGERNI